VSFEDYSFFEILRGRIIWTVVFGTATSVVLYLIHFASGRPHDMGKACLIAYGVWGIVGWIVIDNED
jgi:hypothetical protein